MDIEEQRDCLARVKEAEENAVQAELPSQREVWIKIAALYRALARREQPVTAG